MACAPLLGHAILKYEYFMVSNKSVYAEKLRALITKLDDLTRLELAKLPDNKRPPNYDTWMRGPAANTLPPVLFTWRTPVPNGWLYYDDELVRQLEKLWAKYGAAGDVKEVKEDMAKRS